MFSTETGAIVLSGVTFVAAVVNGAIGYGFSSLTVPIALIFYTNRLLNPALVLVEVLINLYVLIINRRGVPAVWARVYPVLIGLLPGIVVGSYLLTAVHPEWIKVFTYAFLLPLILVQAAGIRRPIHSERSLGVPFGTGIGFLYSVTTVSGPPLAVLFNNQGLVKKDFRAALGIIRVVESSFTALVYYHLGLFTAGSQALFSTIVPMVIVGIPLGAYLIRRLDPETFRRLCMSFDVWVVGFGLARVLMGLRLAASPQAYSIMVAAVSLDAYLLQVFFKRRRPVAAPAQTCSPQLD